MAYIFNTIIDAIGFFFSVLAIIGLVWFSLWSIFWSIQRAEEYRFNRQMNQQTVEQNKIATKEHELNLALVSVDPARPVLPRLQLQDGAYSREMLLLAAKYLETLQPVPNVPHSINYSPHYGGKGGTEQITAVEPPLLPAPQMGDFMQLFNQGLLPKDKFLLGQDIENGELVTAGWKDFYSTLIGGASGSGKSTLVRSILAQAALQGSQFMVIDPHYNSGEESLGGSLEPLQAKMLTAVAHNDGQMIATLKNITDLARRRLNGDDDSKTPVVLIIDETTALLQRGNVRDALVDTLGFISQETRKVAVYAIAIGQIFTSNVLPSEVRNCFVNFISCRTRKDNARMMTGNSQFATIAESLTIGQCVRMSPSGEVTRIAVPNCTQQHLEMVAGSDGIFRPKSDQQLLTSTTGKSRDFNGNLDDSGSLTEVAWKSPGSQSGGQTDAQTQRVIDLFCGGFSVSDIVRDINDGKEITGGRLMQQESAKVQAVIREYLQQMKGEK